MGAKPRTEPKSNELPRELSESARRALHGAGIHTLADAQKYRRDDLAKLRGLGPKALETLDSALARRN